MDTSFREGWRSDAASVVFAGITLVISNAIIARAIVNDGLSLGYVVLPWVLEYLAIMWVGVLLTRTWVREPVFRAISGSVWVALGWTVFLLLPYVLVLSWDAIFSQGQLSESLPAAWHRLVDSGVIWACLAVVLGLLVDTGRDVAAWRRAGGTFVWPATHRFGFKFAALLALLLMAPFALWGIAAVGSMLGVDPFYRGFPMTWIAFGLLLAAEVLVLGVGTWMHHRALAGHASTRPGLQSR